MDNFAAIENISYRAISIMKRFHIGGNLCAVVHIATR